MKSLFHWMLALGMLVTGSINTLSTKAADQECVENRYGNSVLFNHPFFQAAGMFLGEMLCLFTFRFLVWRGERSGVPVQRAKPHSRFIYWIPAICDMTGTSLMYVGLTLTDASIFQMLRGSVIIFTAILSRIFLHRKLAPHHYVGMLAVMGGTAIVGASSYVCGSSSSSSAPNPALGNVLIIAAQVVVAIQMVVEEKFIGGFDVPALEVVGFEGVFGFCTLSVVLGIFYSFPAPDQFCQVSYCGDAATANPNPCDHFEDSYDAFLQMGRSGAVTGYLLLNLVSIAFFNFLGVSITKHINAATRMVLDSMRTLIVWAFSLAVGWESFCYLQIPGFILLITGTVIYNEIVKVPGLPYPKKHDPYPAHVLAAEPHLPLPEEPVTPTPRPDGAMDTAEMRLLAAVDGNVGSDYSRLPAGKSGAR